MDLELTATAEGSSPAGAHAGNSPSRRILDRLVAVVLLSGSVRPMGLLDQINRSVLDLPVTRDGTLLDWWVGQTRDLAEKLDRSSLDLRVLHVPHAPLPQSRGVNVTVECDGDRYRGTAGALRDLCCQFHDDQLVLVAHAGQVLTQPLSTLAERLADTNADVSLYADHDGTPAGVYLMRCDALKCVRGDGYCDLKEQALPLIAKQHGVKIVRQTDPVGLPMRTLEDVIVAIRHLHAGARAALSPLDQLDGGEQSHFSLCELGSEVDRSAYICDSVVLAGAVVHAGAVVARSVVCPGAVVYRNTSVLERVVTDGQAADPGWRDLMGGLRDQTRRLTLPESTELASRNAIA